MDTEDQVEGKDSNDVFPPPRPTSAIARLVIGKLEENSLQTQTAGSTAVTNAIRFEKSGNISFYKYLLS